MLANARESHCTSAMERGFDRVARLSSDNRLKGEPRTGLLHRYSSTPSGRRASPRRVFEGVPFRRHSQRLFKTRRDKRFDLATATYAQLRNLARSEVCHYLCMEGKKELGKEKWSARSRAVKVVSLANETNIRADRVDKRRGEARRAGRKGRKRERERRAAPRSGPRSNSRREFRFLYNRFNLIPALDRSRRGCERRKNIYFRGVSDPPRVYRLLAIFPSPFLAPSYSPFSFA